MPFGRIFGAVFFLFCAWLGVRGAGAALGPRFANVLLVVMGVSLALGLFTRRDWARWAGVLGAIGMLLYGGILVEARGGALDFACALGALTTAVLLLVRKTAELPREVDVPRGGFGRVLGWSTAISGLGLVAVAGSTFLGAAAPVQKREAPALPAVGVDPRVVWTDFGKGVERARAEDKPMLVTFETSWCGYCKKMDQTTWKHPSVVERLSADLVPVKVNTEDGRDRGGYSGTQLAGQFQVSGTPTQLVLDPQGRVLGRRSGYQDPRQFLTWLEGALGDGAGRVRVSGP